MHQAFLAKHQLTEILISSDKHCAPLVGHTQYFVIADSRVGLSHIENIVAIRAQPLDDGAVYAFVSGELHAALLETG